MQEEHKWKWNNTYKLELQQMFYLYFLKNFKIAYNAYHRTYKVIIKVIKNKFSIKD